MIKEIKRNVWSKFLREFSVENKNSHISARVVDYHKKNGAWISETPFKGLKLNKRGKLIDGVNLFAGEVNDINSEQEVLKIRFPEKIVLEKNSDGTPKKIEIHTNNDQVALLTFNNEE